MRAIVKQFLSIAEVKAKEGRRSFDSCGFIAEFNECVMDEGTKVFNESQTANLYNIRCFWLMQ